MTNDADTFDEAYDRYADRPGLAPDGLIGLLELAGEVGRVLSGRSLTDFQREQLYQRAAAIVEAGLSVRPGWAARVLEHRRIVLGGAVAALAAAGALGFVVHERRSGHPRIAGLRIAA